MFLKKKQHGTDFLFPLLLLLLFALFALILAGTGALVYRNSVSSLDENYTSRTAIAYISEKIRQYNADGQISLSCVEDIPALALHSAEDEETATCTYIYYYNDSLRELLVREEATPSAAMGTALVDLSAFTIECLNEKETTLLRITATSPEGEELSLLIHPLDIAD